MERNKMEQEFAEKLNQREITPSNAAWDRLDAMLTATEAQKPKRNFLWLYVAASFLGFLLIGSLFFRQNETLNTNEENSIATETAVKPETQSPAITESANENVPKTEIASAKNESEKAKKNQLRFVRQVNDKVASPEKQQYLANNEQSDEIETIQEKSSTIITRAEWRTGASNQKTQLNTSLALANNSDALLADAQAKRDAGKTKINVNAKSLLSQVDSQAEEKLTLKQKAIRALNKNYQQVKVAIENRNVEENH